MARSKKATLSATEANELVFEYLDVYAAARLNKAWLQQDEEDVSYYDAVDVDKVQALTARQLEPGSTWILEERAGCPAATAKALQDRYNLLTQGQIAGALHRLEKAGRIVKLKNRFSNRAAEFCTVEEQARQQERAKAARHQELVERHGDLDQAIHKEQIRLARLVETMQKELGAVASHEDLAEFRGKVANALGYRGFDLEDDEDLD